MAAGEHVSPVRQIAGQIGRKDLIRPSPQKGYDGDARCLYDAVERPRNGPTQQDTDLELLQSCRFTGDGIVGQLHCLSVCYPPGNDINNEQSVAEIKNRRHVLSPDGYGNVHVPFPHCSFTQKLYQTVTLEQMKYIQQYIQHVIGINPIKRNNDCGIRHTHALKMVACMRPLPAARHPPCYGTGPRYDAVQVPDMSLIGHSIIFVLPYFHEVAAGVSPQNRVSPVRIITGTAGRR